MSLITKVKFGKENKIHIEYKVERQVNGKTDYDEFTLNCVDKPRPEFEVVFINLRKHVLEICELPADVSDVEKVIVKGVSFSYSESESGESVMGATITASRSLSKSNAPLIINTPHKFDVAHNDKQPITLLLTPECADLLYELIEEAEKYIDGERSQLNMFDVTVKAEDTEEMNLNLVIPEAAKSKSKILSKV